MFLAFPLLAEKLYFLWFGAEMLFSFCLAFECCRAGRVCSKNKVQDRKWNLSKVIDAKLQHSQRNITVSLCYRIIKTLYLYGVQHRLSAWGLGLCWEGYKGEDSCCSVYLQNYKSASWVAWGGHSRAAWHPEIRLSEAGSERRVSGRLTTSSAHFKDTKMLCCLTDEQLQPVLKQHVTFLS